MLLEIAQWLAKDVRVFNVFNYITLRAVLACLTALAVSLILGPYMIRKLTAYKIGQAVREEGPRSHLTKAGTPTMGVALILVSICLTYFGIVGTSNAVTLTDGLDGLAIMPTVMVGSALGIFAYVAGHAVFSKYLGLPYIPGAGELAVICGALAGAGLGFLWFNAYPAEVFMGDVGALALGAALGTVAVIVRQEIVLFIMGGVFVAETLSVMIQVVYFKWSGGKRIFRMAPLHHHYELEGWKESQVVVRFWIITMMLVLFGLSTLKLR